MWPDPRGALAGHHRPGADPSSSPPSPPLLKPGLAETRSNMSAVSPEAFRTLRSRGVYLQARPAPRCQPPPPLPPSPPLPSKFEGGIGGGVEGGSGVGRRWGKGPRILFHLGSWLGGAAHPLRGQSTCARGEGRLPRASLAPNPSRGEGGSLALGAASSAHQGATSHSPKWGHLRIAEW